MKMCSTGFFAIGTYTDQELDHGTGLYNYDARLYDPVIGMFITPDPYFSPNLAAHRRYSGLFEDESSAYYDGETFKEDEFALYFSNPQKLNRYSYVLNNPLKYTDPTGLTTSVIIIDTMISPKYGVDYPHAAVMVDNPNGESIFYDPGGSFGEGTDGVFYGGDLGELLTDYVDAHVKGGSTLHIYNFDTSAEDEEKIADKIMEQPAASKGFCAQAVSSAIKGVGPFKDVNFRILPSSLKKDVNKAFIKEREKQIKSKGK